MLQPTADTEEIRKLKWVVYPQKGQVVVHEAGNVERVLGSFFTLPIRPNRKSTGTLSHTVFVRVNGVHCLSAADGPASVRAGAIRISCAGEWVQPEQIP